MALSGKRWGAAWMARAAPGASAALREDLARHVNRGWASKVTLCTVRLGADVHARSRGGIVRLLWRLADLIWLRAVMGAEFPPSARIGPGLGLPHGGRGVTLAAESSIGARCTIYPSTTIGQEGREAPRLLDDVTVATGARVLGSVCLGAGATVGANTVVVTDVPAGATAFGVPARILRG